MSTGPRRVLDVSELPALAFGHHATIWWGTLGLITIESTMFGLMVATYLYLRLVVPHWPPLANPLPGLAAPTANAALLLVSLLPMIVVHRAALARDRRRVGLGLIAGIGFGIAALVLRGFEFRALGVRWDAHAYASVAWVILGFHTGHLLASTVENVLLALVIASPRLQPTHFVDTEVNAIYWYFVVVGWLPMYLLVFFGPRLF
jgi:cytochrome c oxidase subunit 1/cytochrome c oxidase subunit I+III